MLARGCDAEVLLAETGAERVEGLHVVSEIVRARGHAAAHDADVDFNGAEDGRYLAVMLAERRL